jgi:hypothetical protein
MSHRPDPATVCGHEGPAFGSPVCAHLRKCSEPWLKYVNWYTGAGLNFELLCEACANERTNGAVVTAGAVCERCFLNVIEEVGDLVGVRGAPEVRTRPEPFAAAVRSTTLPAAIGRVTDLAPIHAAPGPSWLLLSDDGGLTRFDAATLEWARLAEVTLPAEAERKPWCGHQLRRRLYVSPRGEFAAVVNDFGRWGRVVDLRSGKLALSLDGGNYHAETVPFSFAFVELGDRALAIHRTAWNRLDISDPATGELLTSREPTSYSSGQQRPEHYLDYFHGALFVSPGSTRVLDDGWVWHPVGIPSVWSVPGWIENVWESEDGPSRVDICPRAYYWNGPFAWIDEKRVAVGGLGDDDDRMVPGCRVFDVSMRGRPEPRWRPDGECAREVSTFAGPAGVFFSDGKWLFSSDETGLSRWDPVAGERTGHLPGFQPTHHHRGARELVELRGPQLERLSI